jgi:hypothetical protein
VLFANVVVSLLALLTMKSSFLHLLLVLMLLGCGSLAAYAQNSENFAVVASATVQIAPNRVTLHWVPDSLATGYDINRRIYNGPDDFNLLGSLTGADSAFIDNDILVGGRYEYQLIKTFKKAGVEFQGYGYLAVGVQAPLIDKMGGIIVLIDSNIARPLAAELDRYEQDLIGDGWFVIRHVIGRSAKVTEIKAIVQRDFKLDPVNTRSLFIFGHVPVPYSGLLHPDAHPNHLGAWPADVYYGNFDSPWTDSIVNDATTQLARPEIRNVKGDGKFDLSMITAPMNLEVGRVDLWGMNVFAKSDTELLRQYLNKDHAFRYQTLTAPARGLISDNFGAIIGTMDAEAFASDAWRAFPAFFGIQNTHVLDWFSTLDTAAYLCAYGCGGGSFTSAGGIGQTADFATKDSKVIFTMLFGSYFGDWDIENNFLRAPLCTSYGLTSCWSGRPHWVFHQLTLGEPIGVCARAVEDSGAFYIPIFFANHNGWIANDARNFDGDFPTFVSAELLGDPTLKLFYPLPINVSQAALTGQKLVHLTWTPVVESGVAGVNIYRSPKSSGPFTLINPKPLQSQSYVDTARFTDSNFYMIRSVKLIATASGSYYAASEGKVMRVIGVTGVDAVESTSTFADAISVKRSSGNVIVSLTIGKLTVGHLAIYDLLGREVATLRDGTFASGTTSFAWVGYNAAASGTYFVRLRGSDSDRAVKFSVSR